MVIDLSPMKAITVDPASRTARAEGGVLWREFDRGDPGAWPGHHRRHRLQHRHRRPHPWRRTGLADGQARRDRGQPDLGRCGHRRWRTPQGQRDRESGPVLGFARRRRQFRRRHSVRVPPASGQSRCWAAWCCIRWTARRHAALLSRLLRDAAGRGGGVCRACDRRPTASRWRRWCWATTGRSKRANAFSRRPASSASRPPIWWRPCPTARARRCWTSPTPNMACIVTGAPRSPSRLSDELIKVAVDGAARFSSPSQRAVVLLCAWRGHARAGVGHRVRRTPDAMGLRRHRHLDRGVGERARTSPGCARLWGQLEPHLQGSAYINHIAADDQPEKMRASFGENHQRLREIKAVYDKANLFRVNSNIPPA